MSTSESAPSLLDDEAGSSLAPATATATESPPLLIPLRNRDFRLLFGGETASVLGDQFHFVALAWLVLQLTGSGVALGTVLMTAAVPRAIFILVGGASRWRQRGSSSSSAQRPRPTGWPG